VNFCLSNMFRVLASLLLSLACAQALADPPLRVARLAYVRGPVSFSPAGTDDWALASLNRPLIAGDRLWTEPAGRDELQLSGAALRMDGGTLLSILTLDDRVMQVQLSQGTLNVRVRPGPAAGSVEVDTPNLALVIEQPGHYRIGVDPAGNSTVVRVDDGQAQAMGQYQAYSINPGQFLRFTGPDLRNVQALDPRYRDEFDRWSTIRDQRADRALARRYVSPATIGYDDLDDYGTWRMVPAYGHVWIPRGVQRGWTPYRDGHWAWIEPWGWTWIDDAPWGFAVTHYGRWANLGGDWAWVPEPANAMPVYAPALVAFAAIESGWIRSAREPAVAWFPLGPREPYRPPYAASPRYVSAINYNIVNVTNNVYVNRGAVTVVPASAFTRSQPVRRAAMALPREHMEAVQIIAAPQLQATRESRASHLAGGHRPAAALLARPAMTHMQPAIARAPSQPAMAPTRVSERHPGGDREHMPVPASQNFAHGSPEGMSPRGAPQAHVLPMQPPRPADDAERRAWQSMHQPAHAPVQMGHARPERAGAHGQPEHGQSGRPELAGVQREQDRGPQPRMQPVPRPESQRGNPHEQIAHQVPHGEADRAPMPPREMAPRPQAPHAQNAPRPEPSRAGFEQPHGPPAIRPEPQRVAQEAARAPAPHPQMAPRPEPARPHEPPHAPPQRIEPPHPQPAHAEQSHAQPPQRAAPPHPQQTAHGPEKHAEPEKGDNDHGQHGHKDEHH
jgi:hypothetical protein